ncbi:MAG: DUF1559 domain-containing protein [Gemmataceae bacterium]
MIRFFCPCGRQLQARDEDVGKKAKCPACGQIMPIPSQTEAAKSRPTAEEEPAEEAPVEKRRREEAIREDRDDDSPRRNDRRAKLSRDKDDIEDEYEDEPDDRPRKRRRSRGEEQTSGKATTAMVLGLISLCLPVLPAIPGLIIGVLALREIGRSNGRLGGRGAAITGIVTSCLSFIMLLPVVILLALLLPAVGKVRDASARMQDSNNMKQIGLAMHNFADINGGFPRAVAFRTKDGRPGLSWRVALLPYVEQGALFQQFKLDEAWDSPANKPLLSRIPPVYLQPNQIPDGSGQTHYQVFVGKGTIFEEPANPLELAPPGGRPGLGLRGIRMVDIPDGTSNTILAVNASSTVPWTKPEDLTFDPAMPLPKLGGPSTTAYTVLFADGSVRSMPVNTPEMTLKQAITRNGGEAILLP